MLAVFSSFHPNPGGNDEIDIERNDFIPRSVSFCEFGPATTLPNLIQKTGGVPRYANVTRLELLSERLIDLGLASREMMEFFVDSGAIEKLREVGRFSTKAEAALIKAGFEL